MRLFFFCFEAGVPGFSAPQNETMGRIRMLGLCSLGSP